MLRFILVGLALTGISWGATSPWLSKHHTHDHDYDPLTPEDEMPRITTKNGITRAVKGANVTIECDIIRLGKSSVIWHKNKFILWVLQGNSSQFHIQHVTQDPRIGNNGTSLVISDVRESDDDIYSCKLSEGGQNVTHRLMVNVPPSIEPKHDISFVKGHEGETVELECQVSGKPRPEVTWQKVNGKKMNATTVDTILSIPNITSADAGDYECIANNGVGEPAKATVSLDVQYAPIVTIPRSIVHSGVRYDTTLYCAVDASPPPKVDWYKEGAPVNPMRLKKGIEKENRHFLLFESVLREDFGLYSCNASNYWGNDSAIVELTGRPLAPKISSNPNGKFSDNFSLTWEVKSYEPVTSYFVFIRNMSGDASHQQEWINVTVPGNPSSSMYHSQRYILTDLFPGTRLEAKVQANNEFGESDFSRPFLFQTFGEEVEELPYDPEANMVMEMSLQDTKSGIVFATDDAKDDGNTSPDYNLSSTPITNEGSNESSIILSLREELQNASSLGIPSMTAWEKRSQLMSLVTAISLSCFFYLFAMR